jgi:hypothetical protein
MTPDVRYVIVTPVRDEEKHIEATLRCVSQQTIQPAQWVIVDDGSRDGTGSILRQYAKQFPWMRVVERPNRGYRKPGTGVVETFYEGHEALEVRDWEFLVKLDGDLSFERDYFAHCFEHFRRDANLGIGGGAIYHDVAGVLKLESGPKFHVRGATKIYRRECWDAIGGLQRIPGWDTLDELKANMLGWQTRSFENLRLLHHRQTGLANGLFRDRVKHGLGCYATGYHPLFVIASCLFRLNQKPYVLGSAAMCWGFLKGPFSDVPRVNDSRLVAYVQKQQLRRLCGLETIWK